MKTKIFSGMIAVAAALLLPACQVEPLTPVDDPDQHYFPHGQHGPLLIDGDTIVRSASWTRGDGVEFFDRKTLKYKGGVPSAGYSTDIVSKNKVAYITTNYSIFCVRYGEKFQVLENILIAFPNGGVNRLVISGDTLYCTTVGGLREYRIRPDGRLVFLREHSDLAGLSTFAVTASGVIHAVVKAQPRTVVTITPDGKTTKRQAAVSQLLTVGEKCYAVSAGNLYLFDGTLSAEPLLPKNIRIHRVKNWNSAAGFDVYFMENKRGSVLQHVTVTDKGVGTPAYLPDAPTSYAHYAASGNSVVWTSGHYLYRAERGKKSDISMPLIQFEAPVVLIGDYAYSIQRTNQDYLLYGRNVKKTHQREFDVTAKWSRISKRRFYYDIVIPPFAFCRYKDFLFAPEAVLDVSNPAKPEFAAAIDGPAACIVKDDNDRFYLAQGDKLSILDGNALPEVKILATIPADKTVMPLWTEVAVSDDGKTLFANGRDKLVVYDIADPAKPVVIATLDLPGVAYRMVRYKDHLYIPPYGNNGDFRIVNISDPAKPAVAGIVPGYKGKGVLGIQINNDKMYVAQTLYISRYSLEDPAAPVEEVRWSGHNKVMLGYNYIDILDGILVGKKYPRFDVWRIEE